MMTSIMQDKKNIHSRSSRITIRILAVAFWLLAPALLAPKKFRPFAVAAALLFGVTTAVFRIGQGAHFFSDVAFSALVMSLLIVAVYRRLF